MVTGPTHENLAPLAALIGTWSGRGRGEYPTIEPFAYEEHVSFTDVGRPFLVYTQRSSHLGDGRPLHSEVGYWRAPRPGRVEVVLAHPTGIAEVTEGEVVGSTIRLRSTSVTRTATAKEVTALERDFEISEDRIRYSLRMAAVGRPLTHHLSAELHRAG